MIFKKIIIALCLPFLSHASLEQHFKKAPNKEGVHSIKNIDFIYMINLDERPEKFERSLSQLEPFGIYPYRFSAVNGWNLTPEVINDVGVKLEPWMKKGFGATSVPLDKEGNAVHEKIEVIGRTYFVEGFARGPIGIALSHLSILQDAYDCGYETIWVMEDDIEVIQDPRILPDLIEKLDELVGKENWDILFTDKDYRNKQGEYVACGGSLQRPNFDVGGHAKYRKRKRISEDFQVTGARFGAHSMIIRRSGMKKLLDFVKTYKIYLPYDLDYFITPDIKLFTTNYDVVANMSGALSDNGAPTYQP